jgi:hypothetical protein
MGDRLSQSVWGIERRLSSSTSPLPIPSESRPWGGPAPLNRLHPNGAAPGWHRQPGGLPGRLATSCLNAVAALAARVASRLGRHPIWPNCSVKCSHQSGVAVLPVPHCASKLSERMFANRRRWRHHMSSPSNSVALSHPEQRFGIGGLWGSQG